MTTTVRDDIARTLCRAVGPECDCAGGAECWCIYYKAADGLLASDSVRLELAAKLGPWRSIDYGEACGGMRDVIAKAICWGSGWSTKDQCSCKEGSECAYYADADASIAALLSAPDSVRLELAAKLCPWRPMSEAKKGGPPLLLKLKNPIPESDRDDLRPFDGLCFVGRCPDPEWGWNFAAPVGMGGFPDKWFEGWLPLPAPPSEET